MIKNASPVSSVVSKAAPFADDLIKLLSKAQKITSTLDDAFKALKSGAKLNRTQTSMVYEALKTIKNTDEGAAYIAKNTQLAKIFTETVEQGIKAADKIKPLIAPATQTISEVARTTPKSLYSVIEAGLATRPVLRTFLIGATSATLGLTVLSSYHALWAAVWQDTKDIEAIVKTITSKLSSYSFENQQWKATVDSLNKQLELSSQLYSYGKQEAEALPPEDGIRSIPKYLSYQKAGKERLIRLFDYILSKPFTELFNKSKDLDDEFWGDVAEAGKSVLESATVGSSILDINIVIDAAKKGKDLLSVNDNNVDSALNNLEKELARTQQSLPMPTQPKAAEVYHEFKKIAKILRLI